MKIVEVIVLVGAHCVSPVQQIDLETVVGKVPCGVVIHKDTERRTVTVVPASETGNPKVQLALGLPQRPGSTDVVTVPAARTASPDLFKGQVIAGGGATTLQKQFVERVAPPPMDATAQRVEPASSPPDLLPPPSPPPAAALAAASAPDVATDEEPSTSELKDKDAAVEEPSASGPGTEKVEAPVKPAAKKPARVAEAAPRRTASTSKGQCRGSAKPVWYTNKSGNRKYRCVVPGKNKIY